MLLSCVIVPLCWLPQGTAEFGVGFLSSPLPEDPEYWCVSEQGKAAVDCIVDLVLASVLSLLSPKGNLS